MSETFEEMALRVASYELHDDSSKLVIIEFATRIRDELCKGQEPATAVVGKVGDSGGSNMLTNLLPMGTKLYLHPSPIPADMVMVPREPTEAMISTGYQKITIETENSSSDIPDAYKAMIAAYELEAPLERRVGPFAEDG